MLTVLISEVDALGFEHLKSNVHVVDLLQAADGRQPQPARQTPVLEEELHHTPGGGSMSNLLNYTPD